MVGLGNCYCVHFSCGYFNMGMKIITFTPASIFLIYVDTMDGWEWQVGFYTIIIVACALYTMFQLSKDW
jgi:hypothetical protein